MINPHMYTHESRIHHRFIFSLRIMSHVLFFVFLLSFFLLQAAQRQAADEKEKAAKNKKKGGGTDPFGDELAEAQTPGGLGSSKPAFRMCRNVPCMRARVCVWVRACVGGHQLHRRALAYMVLFVSLCIHRRA